MYRFRKNLLSEVHLSKLFADNLKLILDNSEETFDRIEFEGMYLKVKY